jgi:hypothetical protein
MTCLPSTPSTHGTFVRPEFASTDIDGKYTTYDLRRKYGKLFRSDGVSMDPLSEVESNAAKERMSDQTRTCPAYNPKPGCVAGQKPVKHSYTAFRRWA